MFGLMNLETGKCMESEGSTFHKFVEDFNYRVDGHRIVAVPKDYINSWDSGHKCEYEGCFKDGSVECSVPGYPVLPETLNTIEHFCPEHAYEVNTMRKTSNILTHENVNLNNHLPC